MSENTKKMLVLGLVIAGIVSAVVVIIGAFLPYLTSDLGAFGKESISGFKLFGDPEPKDGYNFTFMLIFILAIIFAIALVLKLLSTKVSALAIFNNKICSLVIAVIGIALVIFVIVMFFGWVKEFKDIDAVKIGIGLILQLIFGIIGSLSAIGIGVMSLLKD